MAQNATTDASASWQAKALVPEQPAERLNTRVIDTLKFLNLDRAAAGQSGGSQRSPLGLELGYGLIHGEECPLSAAAGLDASKMDALLLCKARHAP
jgi:hypothetical protein